MTSRPRSSGRNSAAATPQVKPPGTIARRDPPLGDAARDAAIRLLALQVQVYPDFDLGAKDRLLNAQDGRLSPLDAAFAHAIYDACIRRWLTLAHLIQRSLTQPFDSLEARVRAVLLAGATQLLFLEKVPPHAAINHAVEWAKKSIRPGAGSLANAVLRRIALLVPDRSAAIRERFTDRDDELPLDDGRALGFSGPVFPPEPVDRLRAMTSHPKALLEHWLMSRPLDQARSLCLHSLYAPPTVINAVLAAAEPNARDTTPHSLRGHFVFQGTQGRLSELLASRDMWVQDPASSFAVESLAELDRSPEVIVDLCAGRGTKTRQLAAMFRNARIVATDIDGARRETLASVFAGSAQVSVLPPRRVFETLNASADLVLLDVPCSNSGVLARRPEARYRFSPVTLASLVSVQKQIIAALPLLRERPPGRILYSTCSLEHQENLDQVRWAQRWHRLPISRERQTLPAGLPGDPPAVYHDGSFSALLG